MTDPITEAIRSELGPLTSPAKARRVAVAVLRAVREPSEEAREAGGRHEWSLGFAKKCGGEVGEWRDSLRIHFGDDKCADAAARAYRAMIDTLISELEKEPAE